jgi:hypothetical protein
MTKPTKIKTYFGTEYWYDHNLHRTDGPAVFWLDEFVWYLHGKQHRYYGPADHMGEWYIHGEFIHDI